MALSSLYASHATTYHTSISLSNHTPIAEISARPGAGNPLIYLLRSPWFSLTNRCRCRCLAVIHSHHLIIWRGGIATLNRNQCANNSTPSTLPTSLSLSLYITSYHSMSMFRAFMRFQCLQHLKISFFFRPRNYARRLELCKRGFSAPINGSKRSERLWRDVYTMLTHATQMR